jgi:hypothetical protein
MHQAYPPESGFHIEFNEFTVFNKHRGEAGVGSTDFPEEKPVSNFR